MVRSPRAFLAHRGLRYFKGRIIANPNVFTAFAQPVRSVQDYTNDRITSATNALALQEKRRANALAEAANVEAGIDNSTFQRIVQETGGDENKLIAALRTSGRAGLMAKGATMETGALDRRKKTADIGKVDAETLEKQLGTMKFFASGVMASPTLQNATFALDAFERATGRQMPEERQRLQAMKTADEVKAWAAGHALKADELLPKLQNINAGGAMVQQAVDPLTGRATETGRTAITVSPGEQLQADTSRANNQASLGVQIRGQNLTNARAVDSNATQRQLLTQETGLKVEKLQQEANDRARAKNAGISAIGNQISVIDKALDHPGRKTSTGLSGTLDPRNYVPGTDATDFRAVLDQIGGSAFLQAFESLKGGGAITEMEGKKATDAIARLNRAQSDGEFEVALGDLRQVMTDGYKRMSGKDFGGTAKPAAKPSATKSGATASNW